MELLGFGRTGEIARREWLARCVQAGLMLAVPLRARGGDSRDFVSTPAKREKYLKEMLHALCTELGPRPACSRDGETGMLIIKREMERALPVVAVDTFPITGWALTAGPELRVGERRLETFLAQNGPGTPESGVRGLIRKTAAGYEIVERESGRTLARITLGPFGPAVTSFYRETDGLPRFSAGRQDVPVLDAAEREHLPAYAYAQIEWIPGCETSNVVGTLPGASMEEILFVAHADTVYVGPGASDNTASMIAMVMLAHGISGTRPKRTLTFLASTGEEIGYLGAKHYAEGRETKGTLDRVKFCVNLDSLTYGPNLLVTTTDRELERIVLDIHRDLGIRSEPRVIRQDDTMDSAPFKAAGARTVYFNSRGHDARTLPLNHRPDDRAETIYPELIESSYLILLELLRRLDALSV